MPRKHSKPERICNRLIEQVHRESERLSSREYRRLLDLINAWSAAAVASLDMLAEEVVP